MTLELANAFEQYNGHRGCQIQTAGFRRHRYRQTIVRVGRKYPITPIERGTPSPVVRVWNSTAKSNASEPMAA